MSELPQYEEFGFRSSYPGPFKCRQGDMRMLILQGELDCIESLTARTLTKAARGAVKYRPLGNRVMLTYGLNVVSSATPPWDTYGKVNELLAAFFVPVWAGHTRNGRFEAERLCISVPHILVDNPMSLVAGREIYGFAKALGRFDPPDPSGAVDGPLRIEGYGGEFDPQSTAGWRPLIEISPVGGGEVQGGRELDGTPGLVEAVAPELIEGYSAEELDDEEGLDLPGGVRLAARLCREIRQGLSRQVFLKQMRDTVHQDRAVYQRVVEAPVRTNRVSPRVSLRDWDVTIHDLDSHPIGRDLGLDDQRAHWSATLKDFEFDVLQGEVIGQD